MTMTATETAMTRLLTRAEAADLLRLKATTLAQWTSAGRFDLPIVRVGRHVRYRLADVEAFIGRQTVRDSTVNEQV